MYQHTSSCCVVLRNSSRATQLELCYATRVVLRNSSCATQLKSVQCVWIKCASSCAHVILFSRMLVFAFSCVLMCLIADDGFVFCNVVFILT